MVMDLNNLHEVLDSNLFTINVLKENIYIACHTDKFHSHFNNVSI